MGTAWETAAGHLGAFDACEGGFEGRLVNKAAIRAAELLAAVGDQMEGEQGGCKCCRAPPSGELRFCSAVHERLRKGR